MDEATLVKMTSLMYVESPFQLYSNHTNLLLQIWVKSGIVITKFLGCSLHNVILDLCSSLCPKFMHKSKFKLDMIRVQLELVVQLYIRNISVLNHNHITQLLGCVPLDKVPHEHDSPLIPGVHVYGGHSSYVPWTFRQEVSNYKSFLIAPSLFKNNNPSCSCLIILWH